MSEIKISAEQMEQVRQASLAAAKGIVQADGVAKRAAAEPLPGPLRDAFALCPDIIVDKWRVRPFYDVDFEFLSLLKHPLEMMYKATIEGVASPRLFLPSGRPMWQAAWIMTHTVDEVEIMLGQPNGIQELDQQARKEFSRLQSTGLTQLWLAVMEQVKRASSTAVRYEPAGEGTEGETKSNPTLLHLPKTDLGGGSISAVGS